MLYRYGNLTQCGYSDGFDRLVYLRSTDVEQLNYRRLLWSVPDEWLYLMSQGHGVEVVDKSSNSKGKIERIFVPVLVDLLNAIYELDGRQRVDLQHHYLAARECLWEDAQLRTKFAFWKDRIKVVDVKGTTICVDKERELQGGASE